MANRKMVLEKSVLDAAYYLLKKYKENWLNQKESEELWANMSGIWKREREKEIETFLKKYEANELLGWPKNNF